jgi:hypothetical protein
VDYYDKITNARRTPETPGANEVVMKVIPDEFNINSNIEFEVVKGKKNVFNYDIVTDFQPTAKKPKK